MNSTARTVSLPTARGFLSQNCPTRPFPTPAAAALPLTQTNFTNQIRTEFIEGSAITPALFAAAVEITSDLVERPGGEVETPIHDALNWRYTRFGSQVHPTLYGAILRNEDGACWQVKLSTPIQDKQKGKLRKYETPVGNGSRAYLPAIPPEIRQRIADRYGVPLPDPQVCVWDWIARHPQIPIILTEGGKKALSLLSLGYVTIALYGVNGGYRKQLDGSRCLIEDLSRFVGQERPITLAFDQDSQAASRRRVTTALFRFGALLEAAGSPVAVAVWNGTDGKGVDDLIVQAGAAAWDASYQAALPLSHWRIQQRLAGRLNWTPALSLNVADLATLDLSRLPTTGIVAIASPKGTGKTKLMAQQVQDSKKVVASGHRIALMRQIGERLNCHYLGDVDKAQGRFIAGGAYTLRLSCCVDSLLAFDPNQFAGCDLVIDEVTQVLRHLLTSSTCAKDGKRPALLARLRDLLQKAGRVIVADADLDHATLHYLRELRGDPTPIFLLRNDYQPPGYPVRLIQSPDASPAITDLMAAVGQLQPGQAEFVATDSKAQSKLLARLIQQQYPNIRVLLLNSETIGGVEEAQFNRNPDGWLAEVMQQPHPLVVIASPTLATGTSIETPTIFQRVWGIFTGVSSTDADMAQALGRVRAPVERIVWCTERGSSYSKISRSSNPLELKRQLMDKTSTTISLIRSGLREDLVGAVAAYHWQSDPHLNLYCQIEAARNRAMPELRTALLVRLRFEGHPVTLEPRGQDPDLRAALLQLKSELKELDAEAIVAAPILSLFEVMNLAGKDTLTPEERSALTRFELCDFYEIAPADLSVEMVLEDKGGQQRGEIRSLEELLEPGVAIDRSVRALARQTVWHQGICTWDLNHAPLRWKLREVIGLKDFLDPDRTWTKTDITRCANKIRQLAPHIKSVLNFTPSDKLSDTQVVHTLLRQLGIKVDLHWSSSLPGQEGIKSRCYRLNPERWQFLQEVLQRRADRRARQAKDLADAEATSLGGSPPTLTDKKAAGDLSPKQEPPCSELTRPALLPATALGDELVPLNPVANDGSSLLHPDRERPS